MANLSFVTPLSVRPKYDYIKLAEESTEILWFALQADRFGYGRISKSWADVVPHPRLAVV